MSKFILDKNDTIILSSGHSVMVGHLPGSLGIQEFSDHYFEASKTKDTIESFGFFGGDIDYNTYYPEVKPEEFKPTDDEIITPTFRLLSEVIVNKHSWSPIDFSKNGVLKASMNMLVGQTVNCDHETNIGNAIGSIKSVAWQESYKDGKFKIPAGINGVLAIDAKANPRIARGINMNPPSIHSNSVTVQFRWEKSHPKMSDEEFWMNLGKKDAKGELVRKMVEEIIAYRETSLVSHGADPFAQKVKEDGKLVNPKFGATIDSFSEERKARKQKFFFMDLKNISNVDTINNTMVFNMKEDPEYKDKNKKNENNTMDEVKEFLESLFSEGLLTLAEGKEMTTELAVETLKSLVTENTTLKSKVSGLEKDVTDLKAEKVELEGKIESDKPMKELGETYLSDTRNSVIANYKKLMGDKADEKMINSISSFKMDALILLDKQYTSQLEEKFPIVCGKCGSKDVSRSSTQHNEEDNDKGDKSSLKSTQDMIRDLANKKLRDK